MKIYLSHSSNYDYRSELYEPLERAFAAKHDIYFPHDRQNNGKNSKEIIASSNVIFAEVSYASTGQGIELGWANDAGVPIVCFHKSGMKPSSALNHVARSIVSYDDTADMVNILTEVLN